MPTKLLAVLVLSLLWPLVALAQTVAPVVHQTVDLNRVGGWAGALATLSWVIGWVLKQPAFGGWLNEQPPKRQRLVMIGIAAAVGAAGVMLNDKMASSEAWLTWVGTILGPTFLHEQVVKGAFRAEVPIVETNQPPYGAVVLVPPEGTPGAAAHPPANTPPQ